MDSLAYKKQHPVELAAAVLKCVQRGLQLKKLLEIGYNRISVEEGTAAVARQQQTL